MQEQNEPPSPKLKFSTGGNAKLPEDVVTFSLPSGYTCPGAKECLTKADVDTGKIIDGPHQKFRCFSASTEARPNVRNARWHNFMLLQQAKTAEAMAELIIESFPRGTKVVRLHVGGDFFNQEYFDAWLIVAKRFYHCSFYAYTKSVHFVKRRAEDIPDNFRITFSMGGKFDAMVESDDMIEGEQQFGIAEVLLHPDEAEAKGLEIDHDDSHARAGNHRFGLLIHGMQPSGSEAAEAVKKMKKEGIKYSYSKKKEKK